VGSSNSRVKPKTIKLVFVASLLIKPEALSKSNAWLAGNQDNVYKWSDMSGSLSKYTYFSVITQLKDKYQPN